MTFNPVLSEDIKLGREAGKLTDHGTKFCEVPNLTPDDLRCLCSLYLMNFALRSQKAQGNPGLLIPARVYTAPLTPSPLLPVTSVPANACRWWPCPPGLQGMAVLSVLVKWPWWPEVCLHPPTQP